MNILNRVTIQNLKKNKTRTLVTIVGILLSVAMFTAVTASISSMQNFVLQVEIEADGTWQGHIKAADREQISRIQADETVEQAAILQNIGYAKIENVDAKKPYLFLMGLETDPGDLLAIHITEGRMPETDTEILLPEHLYTGGQAEYQLGDRLTLDVGKRQADGETLGQDSSYLNREETLAVERTETYTVVGFCERLSFEPYEAPGYTALTGSAGNGIAALPEEDSDPSYEAYVCLHQMREIQNWLNTEFADCDSEVHMGLLRLNGASDETGFNHVLYGMGAILMALIMFGSISLIYNAFSISVSERVKQFGLLKSVGATKKQILHSVLFEALVLCAVGIPFGLLAGIGGIGITFRFVGSLFEEFINSTVKLQIHVSLGAVLIAAAVSLVTVLISAWLPARKAVKISAISAIRQTADVKITGKKVKTAKLTRTLFGFEGMLASKNYKRNKRRYRATVLSLFMSIVLFVSADSFCTYMLRSQDFFDNGQSYDLSLYIHRNSLNKIKTLDDLNSALERCEHVKASTYNIYADASNGYSVYLDNDCVDPTYLAEQGQPVSLEASPDPGENRMFAQLIFIEDGVYREYLKEQGLDEAVYMSTEQPKAVAMDFVQLWSGEEQRYINYRGISRFPAAATLYCMDEEMETVKEERSLEIGTSVERGPWFMGIGYGTVFLMYPYSAIGTVLGKEYEPGVSTKANYGNFYIQAEDAKLAQQEAEQVLRSLGIGYSSSNRAENIRSNRALVTAVTVFAYGFIVLISLIALANVFNTISTNIRLRRREFAMLRSVGMTRKGFRKMMNFECLLYGTKGLLYGIPAALFATWLMYRAINAGAMMPYLFPWKSLMISVICVFGVVFATMLYGMHKEEKENTMDALRNENL